MTSNKLPSQTLVIGILGALLFAHHWALGIVGLALLWWSRDFN